MDLLKDSIIDELYNSIVVPNIEESEKYNNLLSEYNRLFESIENDKIKEKLSRLYELKNEMYADSDKTTFKVGFSLGVKLIIEALNPQ